MALRMVEAQVSRVASDLARGGFRFTLPQLYYAACADAEVPPSHAAANGEAGLGVLVMLLGLILIGVRPAGFVLLGAGLLLVLAGLATRIRRPPPRGRVLTMSIDEFKQRFATLPLPGLIDDTPADAPASSGPDATSPVVVVCDTNLTAAMVMANLAPGALPSLAVRVAGGAANPDGATAVCLHDASPAGCAIVAELAVDSVHVVDGGLRPRNLAGDDHEQVLEGAPARFPRDLSHVLDEEEIEWLRSGRRVELATRTPEQVMAMLRDALGNA